MSKIKCAHCDIRNSSRPCPLANGASLCSHCCAEKRGVACGECRFYLDAENYAIERFKSTGKHRFTLDMRYEEDLDRIIVLAEKGRFKGCARRLEEIAPLIPNSHLLHYAYGIVAGLKNDYKMALFHFNRCIEIFPFYELAWYNKGVAYQKLLDLPNMIRAWNMVKRLTNPEHEMHQMAKKNLDEIEEGFLKSDNQTIDEFLKCEKIYTQAFDQMYSGNIDVALSGFMRVLEAKPDHVQSYGNVGLCHALAGHREEAIAALQKALELDPSYQPARSNLARVMSLKPGEFLSRARLSKPIEYYRERLLGNCR